MSKWITTHIGWVRIWMVALAFLVVGGPVMATEITVENIAGASFGAIQEQEFGRVHLSYWMGAFIKEVYPGVRVYAAYQQTQVQETNITGKGGKAIVSIANDKNPDWTLLIGGGWLGDFAVDADGGRTGALTLDLGATYKWYGNDLAGLSFHLAALVSAIDYGPEFQIAGHFGPFARVVF